MSNSKKLKVAYLISLYPAISHTFVLREILGLREEGMEIYPASINSLDASHQNLTQDEILEHEKTFYIKKQGFFGAFAATFTALFKHPAGFFKGLWQALMLSKFNPVALIYNLAYFAEALILGRWMESNNLHHVHVHFINPATLVALLASKIFPITYSFTSHGPDEFFNVEGQLIKEKIEGALFAVSISNYNRSQLMRVSPQSNWKKLSVIPLGINPDQFKPQPKNTAGEFEILCVGRLVPAKGQAILVEAANRLIKGGLNIKLRLIGEGPDRPYLEKFQGPRIILEGNISQDKIRDFYHAADLFVLPSFAEGVPVVLMEAMSMEIPCVSTFVNGIPELIENNVEGILIPPSNIEKLVETIRRLYGDNALRTQLGKAGRAKILNSYRLNRNLRFLSDLFKREIEC